MTKIAESLEAVNIHTHTSNLKEYVLDNIRTHRVYILFSV